MNWTIKDLEKVNLPHNLDENRSKKDIKGKLPSDIKTRNKGKDSIGILLFALNETDFIPDYKKEYRFHKTRRWRFDWAIPELMIAIEYEGIISEKSRHTSLRGFSGDCEKYNEAAKLGWKVLRYTALNYRNLHEDLQLLLQK